MLRRIKHWIAPPVFQGDEEKTRRASFLNEVICINLLFAGLIAVAVMLGNNVSASSTMIPILWLVLLALGWRILHRGQVAFVAFALPILCFIFLTGANISLGTVRTPTTSLYVIWILVVGMLFQLPGILIATSVSSLAVLGLIIAENAALLPQPNYSVGVTQWLNYSALFCMTAGLVYYGNRTNRSDLKLGENEIEQRKQTEMELRKLTRAVEQSPASIVITDLNGKIEYVNPRFSSVTGYSFDEAVGRTPRILKTDETPAATHRQMWDAVTAGQEWRGEFVNRKKDGSQYCELAIISPITDINGVVTHYLAVKEDITQRKQMEEQIRQLAFHDSLTNLPNRRLLMDRLAQAMAAGKRSQGFGALMFLDLDNFKPLNDQHGHAVGDMLLVKVAQRLKACVRAVDTVSRIGGDEFVVLLCDLTTDQATAAEQANRLAEKILLALSQPYLLSAGKEARNIEHHCSASIGVVLFSQEHQNLEDLLKWADAAMYNSKAEGRNRITLMRERRAKQRL